MKKLTALLLAFSFAITFSNAQQLEALATSYESKTFYGSLDKYTKKRKTDKRFFEGQKVFLKKGERITGIITGKDGNVICELWLGERMVKAAEGEKSGKVWIARLEVKAPNDGNYDLVAATFEPKATVAYEGELITQRTGLSSINATSDFCDKMEFLMVHQRHDYNAIIGMHLADIDYRGSKYKTIRPTWKFSESWEQTLYQHPTHGTSYRSILITGTDPDKINRSWEGFSKKYKDCMSQYAQVKEEGKKQDLLQEKAYQTTIKGKDGAATVKTKIILENDRGIYYVVLEVYQ